MGRQLLLLRRTLVLKNRESGDMSEIETVDFLQSSVDSLRQSIKGIDDSYNNFWDILAELAQNSVDAINETGTPGTINLEIDCQKRNITIEDSGCGISTDRLPKLLNLFSSGKAGDPSSIGEKGVGLKYVLFQTSRFVIESSDGITAAKATVVDANTWKKQSGDTKLPLELEKLEPRGNSYTRIQAFGIEERTDEEDIFSLTFPQMMFVLRTKTAFGNTKTLWGDVLDISIHLKMIDINGGVFSEAVPYKYWTPIEQLPSSDFITTEEFNAWNSSDRDDTQKRKKLQDKVIVSSSSRLMHNNRELKYWACFVPSRKAWEQINITNGLASKENLDDSEWMHAWNYLLFSGNITAATKGMPTAISVAPPSVGNAGYLPNFFIIFEDDNLKFDIGRKAFRGKTSNIYREEAKQIFNQFAKLAKYSAGALPAHATSFNREAVFDEIKKKADLNSTKVKFQKNPFDQEASVIAIFFELIGSGEITGIDPMYMGYQNKYDLYARINDRTTIIEFKSHLRNIISDFSDYTKIFDEMDYIVCWDVNDQDVSKLKNEGIDVEEYHPSGFGSDELPSCVSHTMYINNVTPIKIIDVKRLV